MIVVRPPAIPPSPIDPRTQEPPVPFPSRIYSCDIVEPVPGERQSIISRFIDLGGHGNASRVLTQYTDQLGRNRARVEVSDVSDALHDELIRISGVVAG